MRVEGDIERGGLEQNKHSVADWAVSRNLTDVSLQKYTLKFFILNFWLIPTS